MEILIICLTAISASFLTFFSGFGLGTILMPVFLFFFPLDTAIALTAVVHLLNNILKMILLFKYVAWHVVLRFGIPAFIAAFLGAQLLFFLEKIPALYSYSLNGKIAMITPVKLTLSFLMLLFVILELSPSFNKITLPMRFLSLGGLLSGFFGGLSGHQGALRSVFLLKCGLSKEHFIATGVMIACLVDFSRLFVYGGYLLNSQYTQYLSFIIPAILFAFLGVFLGSKFMKKVTLRAVQIIISVMLFVIALLLAAGII